MKKIVVALLLALGVANASEFYTVSYTVQDTNTGKQVWGGSFTAKQGEEAYAMRDNGMGNSYKISFKADQNETKGESVSKK